MSERIPLSRSAARLIVVNRDDRVLLIEGRDSTRPESSTWWITPGGGLDEGESLEQAARRELLEETGLVVGELGSQVLRRTVDFPFEEFDIVQDETFFLVRWDGAGREVRPAALTEIERRTLLQSRWWTVAELRTTAETVYPEGLADLLSDYGIGSPSG
jgi:8-oxo-dGTP pyrophosphatase MutT (NUDIX family)